MRDEIVAILGFAAFLLFVVLFVYAMTGFGPAIGDLDNHCIVEYLDGTREDIVCSWASERKPAFRSAGDGAIVIEYHDMQRRSIPIARVRSWRFTYGDTEHWGRWENVNGKWQKAEGGAE